ncbi:hypothetical protein [Halobacteriovorax sp. JY17]|uniref:hypothetical protein n=1 Tax=Halobacteriovorax sp. JY17 TaxID=2014617 RepID=UPI000C6468C6|nr:hypothetical protein [Halobacteriovorax sp. JY17]PIK15083.1 MAG: hypothetical protein CES88_12165 [Halobacteriovorax sp. JY17]
MRKFLALTSLLSITLGAPSFGAEIDSYRNASHIQSSSKFLDKKVNGWLISAVSELNEQEVACPVDTESAEEVYDIVKSQMASPFIGHSIAVDLDESLPAEMIRRTGFDYSVYAGINWLEGVSLNLKGLLGLMNLSGKRVGVDKIGHFFVEGFGFFRRAYIKKGGSVASAIRWGKFTERSYFGLTTTGVFSNADLVANFNGMRFWNMLFLFSKDPAFLREDKKGYSREPFLKCEDSKWKLNKSFGIRMFLDDSWDESLNCNYYDSEKIKEEVVHAEASNIGYRELKESDGLVCPRISRSCFQEKYKYGEFAEDLLHASCFDKSKEYRVNPNHYDFGQFPFLYKYEVSENLDSIF